MNVLGGEPARHRVVVVGGGFGGSASDAARLPGNPSTSLSSTVATTTSSSLSCTRWRLGCCRLGRSRRRSGTSSAISERPGGAGRGDGVRPRPPDRACLHPRPPRTPSSSPTTASSSRPASRQSYFGHDELRPLRARHEDDRRRAGAPPTDLRRLRDGRGGRRPGRAGAAGSRSSSSVPARRAWSSPARSASWPCAASRVSSATFDPAIGPGPPARRWQGAAGRRSVTGSPRRRPGSSSELGVELRMGARVIGVDAFGVDVAEADGSRVAHRGAHDDLGGRGAGVAAGRQAGRGQRRRARPRRTHPGAARSHAARVIPRCSPWETWPP